MSSPRTQLQLPLPLVAVLLLAVPLVFHWRPDLFFLWDDWTELDYMAHQSFGRYLIMPDGEIFFPFFHLIFYGLVKICGERYGLLVLVNGLATGGVALLLYLFGRRHLSPGLSLTLSLLYAGGAMHQVTVWNAFYLCFIISQGFFLLALLAADDYGRAPSRLTLLGFGVCAFLSVHSHNYTLLALLALPVYVALRGGVDARKRARILAAVVGLVLAAFAGEYLTLVGPGATRNFNSQFLTAVPDHTLAIYWLCGAFLSPLYFLFWGHTQYPLGAGLFGLVAGGAALLAVWRWGAAPVRRLALFALIMNALPFFLVSLGRYHFSLPQAFAARYVFFTMVGALLLVGAAWSVVSPRIPSGPWRRLLAGVLVAAMAAGQILSLPGWQREYLEMTRNARHVYQEARILPEVRALVTRHHPLAPDQLAAIRRLLTGSSAKKE